MIEQSRAEAGYEAFVKPPEFLIETPRISESYNIPRQVVSPHPVEQGLKQELSVEEKAALYAEMIIALRHLKLGVTDINSPQPTRSDYDLAA